MKDLVLTLFIVKLAFSEAAITITYQGQQPDALLVGDDLVLNWTYSLTPGDLVKTVDLTKKSGNTRLDLARYIVPQGLNFPVVCGNICSNISWVGSTTKGVGAFKIMNITDDAREVEFGVAIFHGVGSIRDYTYDDHTLVFAVRPKVKLSISKTNVTAGDQVTIECLTIAGTPSPTIFWYRNGALLENKTGRYYLNNGEIESYDGGSYKCVGRNRAGENWSIGINVTVNGRPGKPGEDAEARGSSSSLSGGAIAGIVVAILLVVVIVVVLAVILLRRKKGPSSKNRNNVGDRDEAMVSMVSEPPKKDQVWL